MQAQLETGPMSLSIGERVKLKKELGYIDYEYFFCLYFVSFFVLNQLKPITRARLELENLSNLQPQLTVNLGGQNELLMAQRLNLRRR